MEARPETIFKIHAANLNELSKGKSGGPFRTSHECRLLIGSLPPLRRTAIGGYTKVASYDMLGKHLHCSNPVKHG